MGPNHTSECRCDNHWESDDENYGSLRHSLKWRPASDPGAEKKHPKADKSGGSIGGMCEQAVITRGNRHVGQEEISRKKSPLRRASSMINEIQGRADQARHMEDDKEKNPKRVFLIACYRDLPYGLIGKGVRPLDRVEE